MTLSLDNPDFIRRYTQIEGDVVVGGIKIGGKPEQWKGNLRYKYECACEANNTPEKTTKTAFSTSCNQYPHTKKSIR